MVNVQYWLTPLGFPFLSAHYYAAMVFIGALALHLTLKLPIVASTFRREGAFKPLGEGIDRMRAADPDVDTLTSTAPSAPTISRRGMLGVVGLGSLGLLVMTTGANLLGGIRDIALLSPRGQAGGTGRARRLPGQQDGRARRHQTRRDDRGTGGSSSAAVRST